MASPIDIDPGAWRAICGECDRAEACQTVLKARNPLMPDSPASVRAALAICPWRTARPAAGCPAKKW